MKKTWVVIGAVVLFILIVGLSCMGKYNRLVTLNESVDTAWAQVENVLQRRNDLIPNLVNTVRGYAAHEQKVFIDVTEARSKVGMANTVPEKVDANNKLAGALSRLMLVMENYPDLKANQNFLALQEELTSTENRISFARQSYNDQVLFFNNKIQMFPSNIVANMFNFSKRDFFELESGAEREVPKVSFT